MRQCYSRIDTSTACIRIHVYHSEIADVFFLRTFHRVPPEHRGHRHRRPSQQNRAARIRNKDNNYRFSWRKQSIRIPIPISIFSSPCRASPRTPVADRPLKQLFSPAEPPQPAAIQLNRDVYTKFAVCKADNPNEKM